MARVVWQTADGKHVRRAEPGAQTFAPGIAPQAEPDYPADGGTDARGWTLVSGVYQAPPAAARAVVQLEYRWAPHGRLEWASVALEETSAPQPRIVRLATVHYLPSKGTTPADKREQFAPFIALAAERRADLVVLPEALTQFGHGTDMVGFAEPVPGPSTEYFGRLARDHQLYIVAGLII